MFCARATLTVAIVALGLATSAAPAHARFVTLHVQLPAGVDAVTEPAAGLDGTLWTVGLGVNAPTNALLRVDPRTGAIVGSLPLVGIAPDPPEVGSAHINILRPGSARRGPDGALYARTGSQVNSQIVRLTAAGGAVVPPVAGLPGVTFAFAPTSAGFYVASATSASVALVRNGAVVHTYRSTGGALPFNTIATPMVPGPGGTVWLTASTPSRGQIAILNPNGSIRRLRPAPGSTGAIHSLARVGSRWWFVQPTRRHRLGVWSFKSGATPKLACELPASVSASRPLGADITAPRGRLYGGDRTSIAILDTRRGTFALVANPLRASPSGVAERAAVTSDGTLWWNTNPGTTFTGMTADTTGRVVCRFKPPR